MLKPAVGVTAMLVNLCFVRAVWAFKSDPSANSIKQPVITLSPALTVIFSEWAIMFPMPKSSAIREEAMLREVSSSPWSTDRFPASAAVWDTLAAFPK